MYVWKCDGDEGSVYEMNVLEMAHWQLASNKNLIVKNFFNVMACGSWTFGY